MKSPIKTVTRHHRFYYIFFNFMVAFYFFVSSSIFPCCLWPYQTHRFCTEFFFWLTMKACKSWSNIMELSFHRWLYLIFIIKRFKETVTLRDVSGEWSGITLVFCLLVKTVPLKTAKSIHEKQQNDVWLHKDNSTPQRCLNLYF